MRVSLTKVGVLAAIATAFLLFAAVRPGVQTPVAEADMKAPGGISALPTSVPAIPGLVNQLVPAIIGTGQYSIATAFCGVTTGDPLNAPCADVDNDSITGSGSITFTLTRVFPDGAPAATLAGSGGATQVVTDNAGGDLDLGLGVVTVRINARAATTGGTQGVNEILNLAACDELGDCRNVQIVVIDTMLAWGATGAISTASQEQPAFVSYHCDTLGRAPLAGPAANMEAVCEHVGGDGLQGLDDMYDCLYGPNVFFGGPGVGYGTNSILFDLDLADVWCGGNTAALFDNSVTFQTDKGLFDLSPVAWDVQQGAAVAPPLWFYPPGVDNDCSSGQSINVQDADALAGWWPYFLNPLLADWEVGCDADSWQNGVVTTMLLGTGQVGVATITAQQGGGISPPREINVTFTGEAALAMMIEAPSTIGAEGGEFTVMLVDQDLRPVGDETIECTVEPAAGALTVLPQTGTTGSITSEDPGSVAMTLVPTGLSVAIGEDITLTCVLDRDHSVSATTTISLSSAPETVDVDLRGGQCNLVSWTGAEASPATIAAAIDPEDALVSIWVLDQDEGWLGYSPEFPGQATLDAVGQDVPIFICVSDDATLSRPA